VTTDGGGMRASLAWLWRWLRGQTGTCRHRTEGIFGGPTSPDGGPKRRVCLDCGAVLHVYREQARP
jgi:hypothetical protein